MKGPIFLDAIFVVCAILIVLVLTIRFWYPYLSKLWKGVKEDVDTVKEDVLDLERRAEERERQTKSLYGMTPAERAALYRQRAREAGLRERK